jgi:hypothetical protein
MTTDLIIGMAVNYSWTDLKPFVHSLRVTAGYTGRCVLIIGNGIKPDPDQIDHYGIELHDLGHFNEHPIQARFLATTAIIETAMKQKPSAMVLYTFDEGSKCFHYTQGIHTVDIRHVLVVDTGDVTFQSNPMTWVEENIGGHELILVSEGGSYSGDTDSNKENKKRFIATFGAEEFERMKGRPVCNGGIIAGLPGAVRDLQLAIDTTCRQVPYLAGTANWPSDQEVLNFLANSEYFASRTLITGPEDGFAFISDHLYHGSVVRSDINPPHSNLRAYPPGSEVPCTIFHQYYYWKEVVKKEYGCGT